MSLLSERPKLPFVLFIADRGNDFLSLCRLEHERVWIARMCASVSDVAKYQSVIEGYAEEGEVLDARRRRVRNALVHGNPSSFAIVESVRAYSEFLSGTALNLALESFVDDTNPAAALAQRSEEFMALHAGRDAASYWRARVARDGWPPK